MSQQNEHNNFKITSLVPEEALIESLPAHWRSRFEKALSLIHNNLVAPLNWPEIAEHCHISPKHFLHMFRVVFNETPGQYQCRMRLKQSVYYLITDSDLTVKEIAIESGFSSSQALAKALKRELDMSASEIRHQRYDMEDNFASKLETLLGHPGRQPKSPLEASLANSLCFSKVIHSERHFLSQK
ncbi:MAG: helix-turn-helix domain-containing protein [Endozoicomonas sp.]|uniref:helix-turn-helix domain-containing protein n=1 Tax=Endozoicomonas sp. TaxID=1892382 RepID=UPI003D9BDB14